MDPFELDCRDGFAESCTVYRAARFHADKREAAAAAYLFIDAYLDWRDVQSNL